MTVRLTIKRMTLCLIVIGCVFGSVLPALAQDDPSAPPPAAAEEDYEALDVVFGSVMCCWVVLILIVAAAIVVEFASRDRSVDPALPSQQWTRITYTLTGGWLLLTLVGSILLVVSVHRNGDGLSGACCVPLPLGLAGVIFAWRRRVHHRAGRPETREKRKTASGAPVLLVDEPVEVRVGQPVGKTVVGEPLEEIVVGETPDAIEREPVRADVPQVPRPAAPDSPAARVIRADHESINAEIQRLIDGPPGHLLRLEHAETGRFVQFLGPTTRAANLTLDMPMNQLSRDETQRARDTFSRLSLKNAAGPFSRDLIAKLEPDASRAAWITLDLLQIVYGLPPAVDVRAVIKPVE